MDRDTVQLVGEVVYDKMLRTRPSPVIREACHTWGWKAFLSGEPISEAVVTCLLDDSKTAVGRLILRPDMGAIVRVLRLDISRLETIKRLYRDGKTEEEIWKKI